MKRKATSKATGQSRKKRQATGASAVRKTVFPMERGLIPSKSRSGATELKSMDIPWGSLNFNATGQYFMLNGVQEGAGFYNRIGRRIRMKSLHFRATIKPSGTNVAAFATTATRIMIVYDRQANGAIPAPADLIQSYQDNGTSSSLVWDGINMNNRDRFVVLMDNYLTLPPVGAMGASPASSVLSFQSANESKAGHTQGQTLMNRFIKLKGLETHYKASSNPAAIGDIATGSLLLFVRNEDAAVPPAATWNIFLASRLKFFD